MDLFMRATREAFRFNSVRGPLTVEQLWNLPLLAPCNSAGFAFDLDSVGRLVLAEIKELGEESLVAQDNPGREAAAARLEVVKAIIAAKQADAKANEDRAAKAAQRRKLMDALEARSQQDLAGASVEELKAKLAELDAA